MKDKVLFGLFVILAFSIGFTLGGAGRGDAGAPTSITANVSSSEEQVLSSVRKVLDPFLADYRQRYEVLDTEKVKLQAELDTAKQELATLKASKETVSVLKSQVSQQQSEVGGLKASLQNAVNDSASWQQKFLQSQSTLGGTQRLLADSQRYYSELHSKLSVVNSRESDTVNGFTTEERVAFYKVWDKWWDLVVKGTD